MPLLESRFNKFTGLRQAHKNTMASSTTHCQLLIVNTHTCFQKFEGKNLQKKFQHGKKLDQLTQISSLKKMKTLLLLC